MNLSTLRVLDLTRLLPGPFATQLIADLGADVVKVEDTDRGDYAREIDPQSKTGVGTVFEAVNRGKRSVAIDLKSDEGRQAFYDLVETADVVIEGFRPGVVDRLGVDYDTLTEYNEDLVYCSLSGFGQDSPLANRPGHDLNYAALSGFLDLDRADTDSTPHPPGFPVVDMASGLFAAFSILGALLDRTFGDGAGEYVDVAMADVITAFAQYHVGDTLRGEEPRPGESRLGGKYPCYDVYETADSRYVAIAALEPPFWLEFCAAVDREDLVDAHLSDDPAIRAELRAELEEVFSAATRDEWERRLSDVDVATMGVYTLSETLTHDHTEARDLLVEFEDWPTRLGFPAKMRSGLQVDGSIPSHGEHTHALLREVGRSNAEVSSLAQAGAVHTLK
ncbi:CoA transferase [Natronomonas gomsonensis]|uniref:CaiB/BaiF CoA transferase family protein n=1 Tax=Natronomonas gomsonensis TaxID=1046043 RepID=UPI0020CA6513|nr:CaiB/BaiF CoA-transferase family protein [Natronomonas gomsonensis]MCY4729949.1 CoA transferase [Natronomonas gomsonensis]